MTESIFSAFGANAATVETDPFKIPYAKYAVQITGSEVKDIKDIPYWEIEFTIMDQNSEQAGKSANNLLRLSPWSQAERPKDYKTMNARTIGSYKKALLDCGIKEEFLDTFNPRTMGMKIVGIKGFATIGPNKKGYNAIFEFERAQAVSASTSSTSDSTPVSSAPVEVDADALSALMGNL